MLWIEWSVSDDPRSRLMSRSFLVGSMQLAFYGVRALIAARTQPWCLRSVCCHVGLRGMFGWIVRCKVEQRLTYEKGSLSLSLAERDSVRMLWIEWSVSDDPRSRLTSCSFLFGSMQLAFYGVRALIAARTQPWCLRSVCFHALLDSSVRCMFGWIECAAMRTVVSEFKFRKGKSEPEFEFVAELVAASVTACSGLSGACLMILAAD